MCAVFVKYIYISPISIQERTTMQPALFPLETRNQRKRKCTFRISYSQIRSMCVSLVDVSQRQSADGFSRISSFIFGTVVVVQEEFFFGKVKTILVA